MGMYFNSDQTIKMVARLNTFFSAGSAGGEFENKRGDKNKFKKGHGSKQTLLKNAKDYMIEVDRNEDPGGTHQKNWEKWLKALSKRPDAASEVLEAIPIPPRVLGPKSGPKISTVEDELSDLISQAMSDPRCEEIIFVALPGTEIAVDQPATIGSATRYTLIITIRTVEVGVIKARLRAAARRRKAREAELARQKGNKS